MTYLVMPRLTRVLRPLPRTGVARAALGQPTLDTGAGSAGARVEARRGPSPRLRTAPRDSRLLHRRFTRHGMVAHDDRCHPRSPLRTIRQPPDGRAAPRRCAAAGRSARVRGARRVVQLAVAAFIIVAAVRHAEPARRRDRLDRRALPVRRGRDAVDLADDRRAHPQDPSVEPRPRGRRPRRGAPRRERLLRLDLPVRHPPGRAARAGPPAAHPAAADPAPASTRPCAGAGIVVLGVIVYASAVTASLWFADYDPYVTAFSLRWLVRARPGDDVAGPGHPRGHRRGLARRRAVLVPLPVPGRRGLRRPRPSQHPADPTDARTPAPAARCATRRARSGSTSRRRSAR